MSLTQSYVTLDPLFTEQNPQLKITKCVFLTTLTVLLLCGLIYYSKNLRFSWRWRRRSYSSKLWFSVNSALQAGDGNSMPYVSPKRWYLHTLRKIALTNSLLLKEGIFQRKPISHDAKDFYPTANSFSCIPRGSSFSNSHADDMYCTFTNCIRKTWTKNSLYILYLTHILYTEKVSWAFSVPYTFLLNINIYV